MPNSRNIDITRKPIEEQLTQALEAIPRIEPDNIRLLQQRYNQVNL